MTVKKLYDTTAGISAFIIVFSAFFAVILLLFSLGMFKIDPDFDDETVKLNKKD